MSKVIIWECEEDVDLCMYEVIKVGVSEEKLLEKMKVLSEGVYEMEFWNFFVGESEAECVGLMKKFDEEVDCVREMYWKVEGREGFDGLMKGM